MRYRHGMLSAQAGSTPTDAVLGGIVTAMRDQPGWDFADAVGDGELLLAEAVGGDADAQMTDADLRGQLTGALRFADPVADRADWPIERV